ncbi:hypothetical protein BGZ70_006553, partial [Mortierella alpina]
AFTFLQKRLKPQEQHQKTPIEFKDLCCLLTTKSIHDAPPFKNWEGIAQGRDKLIDQVQSMLEVENSDKDGEFEKVNRPENSTGRCRVNHHQGSAV